MSERVQAAVFRMIVFALLFTGLAQMPIFARYYLADVPGFAWTADYYLNHVLHYALAVALMAVLGWRLASALKNGPSSWLSLAEGLCWAGIAGTGLLRVFKNQPAAFLPPSIVMWADWSHLGFVVLLGLATAARVAGRRRTRNHNLP